MNFTKGHKFFNSRTLSIFLAFLFIGMHYYIRTYIYRNWTNVLGWDVLSYYLYLPFTFIHHDPGMANHAIVDYIFDRYQPSGTFYQAFQIPNGNWVPMYTLGIAVLFLPFFFIAHLWALTGAYPADGFSFPYQFCIGNGMMLYIVVGIFVIRKVLLNFFNDRITSCVLILLLLGTNYFHEAGTNECMPHAVLFTFYALVLLFTIRWHTKPSLKSAGWLGFVLGFMILIRGSEILAILIPVLWNVWDKQSFREKLQLFRERKTDLLFAVFCAFLIPFIQMMYWKNVTGHFLFHSYQNTEGFDWLGDHIMKVLFAYKKSWFLYTPMITLPIIGIALMRKMRKQDFPSIFIFFILNFYLISSWAAWWQGGSFGMRYFVESYAVMAIPFGFTLQYISEKKWLMKISFALLAGFFLFLNLFQTWQFNHWMIDGYAMTKAYYWKIFLKTSVSDEDRKLKEVNRDFKAEEFFTDTENYVKRTIGYYDFDTNNSSVPDQAILDHSIFLSPGKSCKLTKEHQQSPVYKIPFDQITSKEHAWIRASFAYFPVYDLAGNPASLVLHLNHKNRCQLKHFDFDLGKRPFHLNEWNYFSVDYLTPYPLSENDVLEVYVYLRGEKELYIDNFRIEAFERKW